ELTTVQAALSLCTVDDLKKLAALLPAKTNVTRKAELVAFIAQHLQGDNLTKLWQQLDTLQQLAVAETLYSPENLFDAARFKAKHGELPTFGTTTGSWGHRETPSRLRLFLYNGMRWSQHVLLVPADLEQRLRRFVPEPAAPTLQTVEALPEHFELQETEYDWQPDDAGITVVMGKNVYQMPRQKPKVNTVTRHLPFTHRDTERDALVDLPMVLRLIDNDKIAVSNKTFRPSAASMKTLAGMLNGGDFYDLKPKANKWQQEIGPIKAFAWPLLLQAAKLAEVHSNKLALSKAGRSALSKPAPETLRLIWQRWLKTKLLDEFNRISDIKGQGGKGKRSMTALASRRSAIVQALSASPVDRWVKVDDFGRFMQAAGFDFDVTRQPWDLYIADPHYGSLGYDGYHNWSILQGRYVLCLLFEYAATLGMVDVAYVDPEGVRQDFRDQWGVDDLDFLSRYDGLMYVRINPLGAYCLGMTTTYTPSPIQARTSLTVLPSLQVNVTGEPLLADEALLLESYAAQESDSVWRLDRDKALSTVESGHQIAELREFLQARDTQPLPETVEAFILTAEQRAQAFRHQGTALLIECADAALADLMATNKDTKKWCQRAGERHLVIATDAEDRFRKAIHRLGYGMPRV
ncbi:MAG: hypothetical protein O7G88_04590, partial [bacterium]|nr:hypothetical protein [bacterium]